MSTELQHYKTLKYTVYKKLFHDNVTLDPVPCILCYMSMRILQDEDFNYTNKRIMQCL